MKPLQATAKSGPRLSAEVVTRPGEVHMLDGGPG